MKSIKLPKEQKYPFEEKPDSDISIKDLTTKKQINRINIQNNQTYKYLQEEVTKCEKNLEKIINSSKKGMFGIISYKKIQTSFQRELTLKEFTDYLKEIKISSIFYEL